MKLAAGPVIETSDSSEASGNPDGLRAGYWVPSKAVKPKEPPSRCRKTGFPEPGERPGQAQVV